jgi:tripartite-type tricarboxylate transporter receptor subunit TctC
MTTDGGGEVNMLSAVASYSLSTSSARKRPCFIVVTSASPPVGFLVAAFAYDAAAQGITRPVTIVMPYAAGGGTDTVARLIGNHNVESHGQPVVIENVVGAGGTTAHERVARAAPDGSVVRG